MALYQGVYSRPGGPKEKPVNLGRATGRIVRGGKHLNGVALSVQFGSSIEVRHGVPHIVVGEDAGKILIPGYFLHPSFGILETVDAHWTGSAWKIALAKRAVTCADCNAEECSVCKGAGEFFIPAGNSFQHYHARRATVRHCGIYKDDLQATLAGVIKAPPHPEEDPGGAARLCPKCAAKKCPACKGKGQHTPIVWIMRKYLKPRGKPIALKPCNTNKVKTWRT